MAAEAAAGDGLRVMLVESRGFLGGNLTIGLPVLGFLGHKGTQIIKGLPQNFIDRLRARGAASEHRPCALHMSLTIIDPEEAKRTALEIMEEKGVEVLLYVFCTDVVRRAAKRSWPAPSSTARATATWPSARALNAARATPKAACSPRR